MLKRKLFEIKNEIKYHKTQDLFQLVEHRLAKTFNLYINELEYSYNKLLHTGELRLLKQLSKEAKIND